jgi:hypothetical protein
MPQTTLIGVILGLAHRYIPGLRSSLRDLLRPGLKRFDPSGICACLPISSLLPDYLRRRLGLRLRSAEDLVNADSSVEKENLRIRVSLYVFGAFTKNMGDIC